MISILSAKFRKHIALFLYGVFYVEFVMAAELPHGSLRMHHADPGSLAYSGIFSPGAHRSPAFPDAIRNHADSIVIPDGRKAVRASLAASPTFRSGRRVLAERQLSPGAVATTGKKAGAFIGGPNQPEMQTFQSVNSSNMVDLFTGDFSYNIPLLDVGGYPVNIAYHSGRSMDEDASWVGLGWNVNPGSITRDMRGLPDDFNGGTDTIKKVSSIKPNVSWGLTAGDNLEVTGLPIGLGPSGGIFHTTYNGWGIETGLNVSINAGAKSG